MSKTPSLYEQILTRLQDHGLEEFPDFDIIEDDGLMESAANILAEILARQGIDTLDAISQEDWINLVQGVAEELSNDTYDLRYVGEHQLACLGFDLVDLLGESENTPALAHKLALTPHLVTEDDLEYYTFDEIDLEKPYLITWPDADTDFQIDDAIAIEPFDQDRFEALAEDTDGLCEGDCEHCTQDCVGKETP